MHPAEGLNQSCGAGQRASLPYTDGRGVVAGLLLFLLVILILLLFGDEHDFLPTNPVVVAGVRGRLEPRRVVLLARAEAAMHPLLPLLQEPHVAMAIEVVALVLKALHVMDDGIVRQVLVLAAVGQTLVILLPGEAEIRVSPDVDSEGVPIRDQDPLPDVELVAIHEHRPFDVLLADPLEPVALGGLENLVELAHDLDATTSRLPRWLHYPCIAGAVDVVLPALLGQLLEDALCLVKQVLATSGGITCGGQEPDDRLLVNDLFLLLFLFLLLLLLRRLLRLGLFAAGLPCAPLVH
mmetsp:Transcript_64109/g.184234  ORF Transcript_64109/g.184234 Transcript_64109/m.184234 type:complete len:295 (-) Transcript_64109:1675-2559(-)